MRRWEKALLCGLAVTIMVSSVTGFTSFARQCGDIRSSVLRLHILANSDSKQDQDLKIKVRDKILSESAQLFETASSKEQAEEQIRGKLGDIQAVAQKEVYQEGFQYPVKAELVNMYFTTRTYGNVTLPAGYYDAVRVTIGAANGHNWWCVLFPPLCIPAAEGSTKLNDVLNSNQLGIVNGYSQPDYKIKFKVVEWYEDIVNFFHHEKKEVKTNSEAQGAESKA